nr:hypothetical protein LTR18_004724 [Exophiala xenobiotica]
MSASALTSVTVTSTPKDVVEPRFSFLDLPPEVRLMIYRLLFKDGVIVIRQADFWWRAYRRAPYCNWEERPSVLRDRSMGLNILSTCKLCLYEAKAALLQMATFDIHFGMTRSLESSQTRGFSGHELSLVRSVTLRGLYSSHAMQNVVKLTIHYGRQEMGFNQDSEDWKKCSMITIPDKIRYLWNEGNHKVLLPHIKKKLETHADATLKLEFGVTCRDSIRVGFHVELLKQEIWITQANFGGKILMEPRSVPTFVAHLEESGPRTSFKMEEIPRP